MLSLETFMPAHGLALDFLLKNSKLNQLATQFTRARNVAFHCSQAEKTARAHGESFSISVVYLCGFIIRHVFSLFNCIKIQCDL